MIKGDYAKLLEPFQNHYKHLRYRDNQGNEHYDESDQTFDAGVIGKIKKLNQRKGLATLYTTLPIGSYTIHDVPLALLEAVSKVDVTILQLEEKLAAWQEKVRLQGEAWDNAVDYAGVPLADIPRVRSFYGTRMELPSSARGYFARWNDEWIPYARPAWQQRWTDDHEKLVRRIRLAASALDFKAWLHGKVFFKPNPDNLDLQRIASVFEDDMPRGIQLRPSAKIWW